MEKTIAKLILLQAETIIFFLNINLNFLLPDFNVLSMVVAILSVIPNVIQNKHFDWFKSPHEIMQEQMKYM